MVNSKHRNSNSNSVVAPKIKLDTHVLIDIFAEIDNSWTLLKLSWVCSRWRKLIFSSDEGLVRRVVQKMDTFIKPCNDDCEREHKLIPEAGQWFNAGIRYCMVKRALEGSYLVKDSHFKSPYLHCIPEDFGPIEETYIQNGRDIAGLNNQSDKIYCRYFDSTLCEGVCVLDIKERTFNYIQTGGYPATIEFDEEVMKIALTNPETGKSTMWMIPQRIIKKNNEEDESYKLRLEGPRNGDLLFIQENNKDEIVQLISINSIGDWWACNHVFPAESRLLTRPGLGIFVIINNQSLSVYDCKSSVLLSRKFHGIRYSRHVNLVTDTSQDFQLTDNYLIYYNGGNKSLYMCSLNEVCGYYGDTNYIKWKRVLKIDISILGGVNSRWSICDLDRTRRYVILSSNTDLGVGMIMFDLITGKCKGYYLEVDLLDPLLALKYKTAFKTKHLIGAYGTRVVNSQDGIWIIDKQCRAVYIMDLRIDVLKKIYSDKIAAKGPLPLSVLGKLIEFKSFSDKETFTKRIKRQIEEKVFQAAV